MSAAGCELPYRRSVNCVTPHWSQWAARHQDGSNLVFVDGHPKWYKQAYVESHPELFYSTR